MTSGRTMGHRPVMLAEAVSLLVTDTHGRYADCTLGMGGHSEAVLQKLSPKGRLVSFDADPEAVAVASRRLAPYSDAFAAVRANFRDAGRLLSERGHTPLQGVLFDLGISSVQLASPDRGISFQSDAPLDMRLDPAAPLTAADIVNTWTQDELEAAFREAGDPLARRMARVITERRAVTPFTRTSDLAALCELHGRRGRIHPATKVFMALRMAVNRELETLQEGLDGVAPLIAPGGRIAVITFHSGEDRIVKRAFKALVQDGGWRAVTRKPLVPTDEEVRENPRARSAKLRVIERKS